MSPSLARTTGSGLSELIVQEASKCRLDARNCTGDRKWALLARAEELEELDHELRVQELPSKQAQWHRKRGW